MLKDTLYKIISLDHSGNTVEATLQINKDNEIFTGHFPNHPVLPGACMLQIVKEVLEDTFDNSFRLKKALNMKFLSLIDPGTNSILELVISYSLTDKKSIDVTASLSAQKDICFKFRGLFIEM
jgi:3-hydroxyacyl-[acyl-carrier-protein] dehydratase